MTNGWFLLIFIAYGSKYAIRQDGFKFRSTLFVYYNLECIRSIVCYLWVPCQLQIDFIILVISLSELCLVSCLVFVWGPSGLLAIGSCCCVMLGLRSLNTAFPCWSFLSYHILLLWYSRALFLKKLLVRFECTF
jgi:hypothetical protein